MQFPDRPELGHLTYCTNIHRGATWPEMLTALARHLPAIRQEAAPDRPFGLGLRIGAPAAESLRGGQAGAELKELMERESCYLFTINGFPYGSFHGERVKEQVYAPDWGTPERLSYTDNLADILLEFLPEGMSGSISTVPGSFAPWTEGRVEAITEGLVRHAAHLAQIHDRTGRTIALALEPEPRCMLETIEETAAYFGRELFGRRAVSLMRELTSLGPARAEEALRRHLGVCYDVCHAAVEFEDPQGSLDLLREKGIAVPKLQLSSALKIDQISRQSAEALRPFDEPVYLHQVVARNGAGFRRYLDLPEALADLDATIGNEWRVHFHVPVFLPEMERFSTTQDFLRDILAIHRAAPISEHLEVETYTWDVLPAAYRATEVSEAIARELNWVRGELGV